MYAKSTQDEAHFPFIESITFSHSTSYTTSVLTSFTTIQRFPETPISITEMHITHIKIRVICKSDENIKSCKTSYSSFYPQILRIQERYSITAQHCSSIQYPCFIPLRFCNLVPLLSAFNHKSWTPGPTASFKSGE